MLLKILGLLHFNVEVDASSLVGFIIEAFRWRFGHGDGVFFQFEVISTQGYVGYQVMNHNKYFGVD